MPPTQTMVFTCQACGHQFQSAWEVVSKQPTCPRCRTFGKVAGPDGTLVGARQNVVKVQHPKAGGGPVAPRPAGAQDDAPVVVAASTAYGSKSNAKSIATAAVLVAIGIATVVVLWILVSAFKTDSKREEEQKKLVVQDPKDFERAVDDSIGKVRKLLKATPNTTVSETTNFSEILELITKAGGTSPGWTDPPRPGTPFKSAGFTITGKETRGVLDDGGFVMLLYYKTADEVSRAADEIRRSLGGNTRNYSITVSTDMWYVAYSGVVYPGAIDTAIKSARDLGKPVTFKQFTDRVGATYKGRDTDG
ncbi:MAG: hypothetical protein HS108_10670 [Planctomycetes bacterium]|nr:hypothetical protein [Planctomycetota bacterium]MCL4731295.1 hypothetical protein [Planctomycetota bacterium]